ncbi:ABC transporter [Mycolicibacterium boenickei]|uniref:ABC transporter n=1 Tax=Mycolicibacterium boenickei TaxID=146017 RepID=A0AAX2ZUZ1_9MYCO|nr:hypothetical protein [Mycolicibacterium boenickei]PEG59633.1 ABC transporter [Mycolicibacterium boenickei]UNB99241.1 ABC transporter [Mycolicibacterium boenickei]BBX88863.1 lipoprotein [Mycolicibacterium boenickei]
MLNWARAIALVGVLSAGCSATPDPRPSAAPRESGRPVTRLVLVERQTGAAAVFDVADAAETGLGRFGRVDAVSGDGRYAYLREEAGLTILDGGAWTYDHGDHSHYYVVPPAVVGRIDGRVAAVRGDGASTVVLRGDGAVESLNREAFPREDPSAATVPGADHARAAVAFGKDLLTVTEPGLVRHGAGQATVLGHCPEVTGAAVLRRTAVLGCRDGALRISRRGGALVAEDIPFGASRPSMPLGPFGYRRTGNSVAAVAGDEVWLLNGRRWASMRLPGVVAVNTADATTVLALTRDGVLHALDVAAGANIGRIALLAAPVGTPVIEVGAGRAYVNDSTARAVHEIDYADGLRVVRTHRTEVTPDHLAAAGW